MPPTHVDVLELQAELEDAGPVHQHIWTNESGQPLACAFCQEPWPGEPLPDVDNWCEPEWRQA